MTATHDPPCGACAGIRGALHADTCQTHARGEGAFCDDLPLALACGAHRGTSHVPEERGAQERASYAATMAGDLADLLRLAGDDPAKRAIVDREWPRYRLGYGDRVRAHLAACGRCMSTMITGAANFPTARNRKRSDAADRKAGEASAYRAATLARIRRDLRPEDQPIRVEDDDAIERLRAKLAELQRQHAQMIAVNAAIRKHKRAGADAQRAAIVALGHSEAFARKALEPDDLQRIGFAPYQLTNSSAEIRRCEARIAEVTARKATAPTRLEGERATLEEIPADNRIRVTFPGKPDAATRERLKRAGFRWAPSIGAWQAYPTHNARTVARELAGAAKPAEPDGVPMIETGDADMRLAPMAGSTIDAGDVVIETSLSREPAPARVVCLVCGRIPRRCVCPGGPKLPAPEPAPAPGLLGGANDRAAKLEREAKLEADALALERKAVDAGAVYGIETCRACDGRGGDACAACDDGTVIVTYGAGTTPPPGAVDRYQARAEERECKVRQILGRHRGDCAACARKERHGSHRAQVIADARVIPLDLIGTLAHVDDAAAPHLRAAFVAFVEATPGAPWDGWRDALEAFKARDEAARCACNAGGYCDRSHDPAVCGCQRCKVTADLQARGEISRERRWVHSGSAIPVPEGHPGIIFATIGGAGSQTVTSVTPAGVKRRKVAARG